jgi:hypothetical protein
MGLAEVNCYAIVQQSTEGICLPDLFPTDFIENLHVCMSAP